MDILPPVHERVAVEATFRDRSVDTSLVTLRVPSEEFVKVPLPFTAFTDSYDGASLLPPPSLSFFLTVPLFFSSPSPLPPLHSLHSILVGLEDSGYLVPGRRRDCKQPGQESRAKMGACMSTVDIPQSKVHSDAIDKQIEEDSRRLKRNLNILLLGCSGSGKSTIVRQMKVVHHGGYTPEELASYRTVVYRNVIDSAKAVIEYMSDFGLECEIYENRALAQKIFEYSPFPKPYLYDHNNLSTEKEVQFSPEIAEAINQVWEDPVIREVMDKHSSDFYLTDNAGYFFGEVLRIGHPGYVPNITDVLRARQKTYGITETRLTIGQCSLHMVDIGSQRSERKKWIHCFEDVPSIIFCTALSEYDWILLGDMPQNRMRESLILFESVINSRWFLRTSIILFLNKIDVFKNKLPKVPLEICFPDYAGGCDVDEAVTYILSKFVQTNKAQLCIYPYITHAIGDNTVIRQVFAAVKDTIMRNASKNLGTI